MDKKRREFIRKGLGAPIALAVGTTFVPSISQAGFFKWLLGNQEYRALSFYNIHTGEALKEIPYWLNGGYMEDGMRIITRFLQDWRTGDTHDMDPELMDRLFVIQHQLETVRPFHVISGYRSPKTNAMLASKSEGVDKNSFHMKGQAIDIRVPGIDIEHVHKAALSLDAGGVGVYKSSQFVHVDTGPKRRW